MVSRVLQPPGVHPFGLPSTPFYPGHVGYYDQYGQAWGASEYGQAAEMASAVYDQSFAAGGGWPPAASFPSYPRHEDDTESFVDQGQMLDRSRVSPLSPTRRTLPSRRASSQPPPELPQLERVQAPRKAVDWMGPEAEDFQAGNDNGKNMELYMELQKQLQLRNMELQNMELQNMRLQYPQEYPIYGDYSETMYPNQGFPVYVDDAPPPPPPPPGSCYSHEDHPPTTMPVRPAWQGAPPTAQPPVRPPPPPHHAFEAEPAKQPQRGAKKKAKVTRGTSPEELQQQDGQQQQQQQPQQQQQQQPQQQQQQQQKEQQQRSKAASDAEQQAKVAPAADLSDIASQVDVQDPRILLPVWRHFVVNVRLRRTTGSFYFHDTPPVGQHVLVAADRGYDLGVVLSTVRTSEVGHQDLPEAEFSRSLPPVVLRHANDEEVKVWSSLPEMEEKALVDAKKLLSQTQMPKKVAMTLTSATYQFDMRKLSFTYDADQYVNYRPLLKAFFDSFQCRIWFAKLDESERPEVEAP